MKRLLLFLLWLTSMLTVSNQSFSQCGTNTTSGSFCTRSNFYYGEILPNAGCGVYTSVTPYSPGEYFRMPVLPGACYSVQTCGAGIDTQIGAFQGTATTGPFSYNDDNGPLCSGTAASITMTPAFNDYARIDVRQYNCQSGGSSSVTVRVRQNNNLNITSSNADMCQGQTRSLTATPTAVVPFTAAAGNGGTFSGTGVSGTVFTAPTPAGASQTYTVTYTYGYCSTSQAITVYRNPSTAAAGADQNLSCTTTSTTLAGNTPMYGTGAWTVLSGPGTVTSPSSPTSTITGLTPGSTTTLQWTITNGPCAASSDIVNINVSPSGDATFSYPMASYCVNMLDPSPTVAMGPGTFSATPAGLSINSTSGLVDLSTSTPGTYTITYTLTGGCPDTETTTMTVNAMDNASFSYSAASYCANDADPTPIIVGLPGGTFSSTAGLSINASTGQIDVSASTPGTYTVTYATSGTCPNSSFASVTIDPLDDASFNYSASSYCVSDSDPTPTITGLAGGTFSSSAGLSINTTTGAIDVSASTPGSYSVTYTTSGSCPNSSVVTVEILNTSFGTDTQVACDSYTWIDGNTYTASNNTATHTLTNAAGCDSIVTLDLTINYSNTGTDTQVACDSYTWIDGNTYTASNNSATHTLTNAAGCDSVVTLDLTINYTTTGTDTQVACDSYTWIDGNTYTASNNSATHTLTNAAGCDSIVTLDLTVNYTTTGTDTQVACDSYTWIDGNTYTASNNTATHTLTNAAGCDSIVTLDLTINYTTTGTDTQVACDSYTWINGNTYTSSNNTATHTLTNAAGCDSIVTLDLTINYSNTGIDNQVACDSYTWIDGNTYTSSNNTATHTLTNAAGCDSIVTLDLTINNTTYGTDTQVACDSYMWIDGNTYTASNSSATHTLTNAAGCDSIVTLDLTINNTTYGTDTQVACDSYMWIDGNTYTSSNNTATHTLTNAAGCDSIVTLDLTINYTTTGTDTQVACDSYTWIDGNTYTSSNNTAAHTLTNAAGCDSIVTLDLTINYSNTGTDTQVACDSYTWIDGNTYTASNNTATFLLTNAAGCDSLVTLDLTVNYTTTGTDTQVACDSYTWIDGNTYTTSNNTATHTLTNAAGCDSIVTLDLTINYSTTGTDTQVACDSYTWIDGNTYTSSNNSATHTLINAAGCDSVVTLDLTVLNSATASVTEVVCETYTAPSGATYTVSGTYTDVIPNSAGCDSIITIDLTVNYTSTWSITEVSCGPYTSNAGNTYSASGTYTEILTTAAGCDSTLTINLTVEDIDATVTQSGTVLTANWAGAATYQWIDCADNSPIIGQTGQTFTAFENGSYAVVVSSANCSDTSTCYDVTTVDVKDIDLASQMSIYPNPTNDGNFKVQYDGEIKAINVIDVAGRVIPVQADISTGYVNGDVLVQGHYFVYVTTDKGIAILDLVVQK